MPSRAADLVRHCTEKSLRLATAESCTGGMVAAAITDIPGSSAAFDRGFVTYSNASKTEALGVPGAIIAAHGAVSEAVAIAMAEGAIKRSAADIAVAVTGIAGPTGGSLEKPVGLVFFAAAARTGAIHAEKHVFSGDRAAVRAAAADKALSMLYEMALTL